LDHRAALATTGIYGNRTNRYRAGCRKWAFGWRCRHDVAPAGAREAFRLALAGVIPHGWRAAAARWLGALVYGVRRAILELRAAMLLRPAAALLVCWRPAWRSAAANPAETIREH
jgi:hypothetical protein